MLEPTGPPNLTQLARVVALAAIELHEYRGCFIRSESFDEATVDNWLATTDGNVAAVEGVLNEVHLYDAVSDDYQDGQLPELEAIARRISTAWTDILAARYPGKSFTVTYFTEPEQSGRQFQCTKQMAVRLAPHDRCRWCSPPDHAIGQCSAMSSDEGQAWFSVRCFFEWQGPGESLRRIYEERVLLWRATDFEDAIAQAEAEAEEYVAIREASDPGPQRYLAMAQAYQLSEWDEPGDGIEVFSLLRESNLTPGKYLTRFFDTGHEHNGAPIT